ncbi:MAG: division/cell wall cluster transcriptional repressor MraZ [Bacillota bacterium]
MLIGEYQHAIDEKGRLTMPSKLREHLGDRFIIARGLENCLFVFPMPEWERLQRRLTQLSLTKSDARAFTRFLFSGATEGEFDRQGRVLIPQNLREYSSIEKDVVVIGVSTRVEIWSAQNWEDYKRRTDVSYEDIAEKLADFDL